MDNSTEPQCELGSLMFLKKGNQCDVKSSNIISQVEKQTKMDCTMGIMVFSETTVSLSSNYQMVLLNNIENNNQVENANLFTTRGASKYTGCFSSKSIVM